MTRTRAEVTARIEALVEYLNGNLIQEHGNQRFTAEFGSKNVRIVAHRSKIEHGGSVFIFVALENGDILKPASYKAPAKHPRGNIFNENFDHGRAFNQWGATYLR